ncbi:hypothetical protein F5Y05DRAFT_416510 [Hypoxylon sp. FL0543]|nr:hypothetical protein F5Y05DRAFT_416510 [Hypoxylon sp. FL0543]
MQQDTTGAGKVRSPGKQDASAEIKHPKLAHVAKRLMRRRELWGRVKDRLPDIARIAKKESKPKRDSESRQSSGSQTCFSKTFRQSGLSDKGKELLRKGLNKTKAREEAKQEGKGTGVEQNKEPDPLAQWFVKHSGGTLRDKH